MTYECLLRSALPALKSTVKSKGKSQQARCNESGEWRSDLAGRVSAQHPRLACCRTPHATHAATEASEMTEDV